MVKCCIFISFSVSLRRFFCWLLVNVILLISFAIVISSFLNLLMVVNLWFYMELTSGFLLFFINWINKCLIIRVRSFAIITHTPACINITNITHKKRQKKKKSTANSFVPLWVAICQIFSAINILCFGSSIRVTQCKQHFRD